MLDLSQVFLGPQIKVGWLVGNAFIKTSKSSIFFNRKVVLTHQKKHTSSNSFIQSFIHSKRTFIRKKTFIHKKHSFIKDVHSKRTHRWPTWPCFFLFQFHLISLFDFFYHLSDFLKNGCLFTRFNP